MTILSETGPLEGSFFVARGPIRGTVLLNAGTGIPRRFYAAFAAHLASRGFATLTYDYRGIGGSAPESLRDLEVTKQDWARHDFSAAFRWLEERIPEVPRFVLGHSVGGQLLALMDRPEAIDGVVTVATSFGYWRYMPKPYGWFVGFLWYFGIPFFTRLLGYVPARRLGLGEDLPAGVALEWARWGKRVSYFTEELADEAGFETLQAPWKAITIEDDDVATAKNSDPLLALYRGARIERTHLRPRDFGYSSIGHLRFFSSRRDKLWPQVSDWLVAQTG
ncbi:MAG: alpha/beta fold hydrolase [Myxococcota bacterium]